MIYFNYSQLKAFSTQSNHYSKYFLLKVLTTQSTKYSQYFLNSILIVLILHIKLIVLNTHHSLNDICV